ncbi:hypothetical protein EDB85DRAFT_1892765 [Lactarius pseudohatsudake]|nr:hypothetical protein EDB85DRAFT_1892765 [Lactarius pseudohatsudake]
MCNITARRSSREGGPGYEEQMKSQGPQAGVRHQNKSTFRVIKKVDKAFFLSVTVRLQTDPMDGLILSEGWMVEQSQNQGIQVKVGASVRVSALALPSRPLSQFWTQYFIELFTSSSSSEDALLQALKPILGCRGVRKGSVTMDFQRIFALSQDTVWSESALYEALHLLSLPTCGRSTMRSQALRLVLNASDVMTLPPQSPVPVGDGGFAILYISSRPARDTSITASTPASRASITPSHIHNSSPPPKGPRTPTEDERVAILRKWDQLQWLVDHTDTTANNSFAGITVVFSEFKKS